MSREKTLAMILLDLCAFACYQDNGEETRSKFEEACGVAEENSLPEIKAYRDFVSGLEPGRSQGGRKEN
jgi:hypothetical protein